MALAPPYHGRRGMGLLERAWVESTIPAQDLGRAHQMAIMVEDLAAAVQELRARGVQFEEYDSPGLKTRDGIADVGYAKAAWFKDSEGNLIGISQPAAVAAGRTG
jgi:hypothetical protein